MMNTPWKVEENGIITDNAGTVILGDAHPEKAAFITKAVNAHDALLEALKYVKVESQTTYQLKTVNQLLMPFIAL